MSLKRRFYVTFLKNTVEILEGAGLSETSIITNFTRCDIRKTLLRL